MFAGDLFSQVQTLLNSLTEKANELVAFKSTAVPFTLPLNQKERAKNLESLVLHNDDRSVIALRCLARDTAWKARQLMELATYIDLQASLHEEATRDIADARRKMKNYQDMLEGKLSATLKK